MLLGMGPDGRVPEQASEHAAWRDNLSLSLLRAFFALFVLAAVVVWTALRGPWDRAVLTTVSVLGAALLVVPAITGRPRGAARSWMVVAPAALSAVLGFATVGYLAGPGALLTVTLMLIGLLLGRRAMIAMTLMTALCIGAAGWAMVHGILPAPDPRDTSMTNGLAWVRSVGITYLAVALFGGLMVTMVARIERALELAHTETRRRELAERARADAEIMALEAKQLETVGRLSAGVAHDFNNDLTAIMGAAQLLKHELSEGAEGRELAEDILQAAKHSADLTRQLLAYSRKAQMQKAPTDLHEVITEALSLLRHSVRPELRITVDLAAESSVILADASLMQSAILNLFVNAADAMPEGGTLTVKTASLSAVEGGSYNVAAPFVLIEIRDTGHGIERALLPEIFSPFFTTKPLGKGTGLGLAAVAGTIKAHAGTITVDSSVGVGTVFSIRLPVATNPPSELAVDDDEVVNGHGVVLLVNDDAMVAATASATLQSFGYEVVHTPGGAAALELVRAAPGRFGLVVLDLRMPGMSGEETFEALRALDPDLPVVLWSGYGAEQDVEGMLRRGAAAFVQKPYRAAELSRVVARAIRAPLSTARPSR